MSTPTLATVARKRGIQTFLTGLGIDVAVTIALFIVANLNGITTKEGLVLGAVALGKTVLIAAAAYVIRRFADKSGVVTREDDDTPEPAPRRALIE